MGVLNPIKDLRFIVCLKMEVYFNFFYCMFCVFIYFSVRDYLSRSILPFFVDRTLDPFFLVLNVCSKSSLKIVQEKEENGPGWQQWCYCQICFKFCNFNNKGTTTIRIDVILAYLLLMLNKICMWFLTL